MSASPATGHESPFDSAQGKRVTTQVCSVCSGTGFRIVTEEDVAGLKRSAAVPCDCRQAITPSPEASGPRGGEPSQPPFESRASIDALVQTGRSRRGLALDERERAVVRALGEAIGQGQAIALKEIGRQTGYDDRSIKGVIERLRNHHGLKVGSSRLYKPRLARVADHEPRITVHHWGYYWCTNAGEVLDTIGPFYRQALTELRTVWRMTDGAPGLRRKLAETFGQVRLDFPEESL